MMASVSAFEVVSILEDDRRTRTPAYVLSLARAASEFITERLGIGTLRPHLVPHAPEYLMLKIAGAKGAQVSIAFFLGKPYYMASPASGANRATLNVQIPDVAEALHFIGIVLNDLNAGFIEIGERRQELNRDILTREPSSGKLVGVMDRCDHPRSAVEQPEMPPEEIHCIVSGDCTLTPVEVFNWGQRVVRRARMEARGKKIHAHIWAYRRKKIASPGGAASDDDSCNTKSDGQAAVRIGVDLINELGRTYSIFFQVGRAHDFGQFIVTVPDFFQALHMIGMVLEALSAPVVFVGNRNREENEDVLARPLEHGKIEGSMIKASNFVLAQADSTQ